MRTVLTDPRIFVPALMGAEIASCIAHGVWPFFTDFAVAGTLLAMWRRMQ